jgi:FtsH-binding integral membrane protein
MNQGYSYAGSAGRYGSSAADRRAGFIVRTYNHLFGAILAFAGIEAVLFMSGVADAVAPLMLGSQFGWLAVLGGFMLVGWLASHWANSATSVATQYLGLGAYVVAQSLVFMPLLWLANRIAPGAIQSAGIVTILGFAGLTAVAFVTRKDFSFLRSFLMWGGIVALVLIVASAIFSFSLGVIFSVAMVGFAGAAILYDTSNVIHHFPEDRHVGAAMQLFASVALLFWYVLRIFMSLRSSN